MSLLGKLYLVVGASVNSDIGLAICKKLAKEGARLILTGRNEEALVATQAQLSTPHPIELFDLAHLENISNWVKELVQKYGAFDGMVYNAGYQGFSVLRALTAKSVRHYFNINSAAPMLLTAAFGKPKHHQPNSSIVYIGSVAGMRGIKARTLYCASKAALYSITQSAAIELAEKKIRVNYIAPGVVTGVQSDKALSSMPAESAQAIIAAHPLGVSEPMDVANSVYFLLSDLSKTITGICLPVDGGFLAE